MVVISREDLREELEEKGIGRLFRDLKQWKAAKALDADKKRNNETPVVVDDLSSSQQDTVSSASQQWMQ
jgi:hypothetical protein